MTTQTGATTNNVCSIFKKNLIKRYIQITGIYVFFRMVIIELQFMGSKKKSVKNLNKMRSR